MTIYIYIQVARVPRVIHKCLGAFGSIWEHVGASGSIWQHLAASGGIWASGSVWEHLGASGSIWQHLGAKVAIIDGSCCNLLKFEEKGSNYRWDVLTFAKMGCRFTRCF